MAYTLYNPPTKWWKRQHSITITIWPKWLAQKLCNHSAPKPSWITSNTCYSCPDCYTLMIPPGAVTTKE